MSDTTKHSRLPSLPGKRGLGLLRARATLPAELHPNDIAAARTYIEDWWQKAERYQPHSKGSALGVPAPYIVPSFKANQGFDYDNELYYWDSYFIAQGLLGTHNSLVTGTLEDLISLFEHSGIIPNASKSYLTGRSQPPFLSSFIFDVYDTLHPGKKWLQHAMYVAELEYTTVWMGIQKPNARQVFRKLSRYYDINLLHDLAEAESGWDMTPRFNRRALHYLPVDLNALLYKYETDFARTARIMGHKDRASSWEETAKNRAQVMNDLMWDRRRGMYFDYDYVHQRRGNVKSLAMYFPMWAGMVDERQAWALAHNLKYFEHTGGLATTEKLPVRLSRRGHTPTQWAYPNGWAPLHFIVIGALERYGYHAEARRVALKWLHTNLWWFNEHHEFIEKYNVVRPHQPPADGVYPHQTGFGWTNAIFERLCRDYIDQSKSTD